MNRKEIEEDMHTYLQCYMDKYCSECKVKECYRESKRCMFNRLMEGHVDIFGNELTFGGIL